MNESVLVLGGSYLQKDFVIDAMDLGCEVLCIDGNPNCDVAKIFPDIFYLLNFGNLLELKSFLDKNNFDAIVAPANELGNLRISEIAKDYGIYYNSNNTVLNTLDKARLKKKLKNTDIKFPQKINFSSAEELNFPIMVKPSNSSASRGVTLVNDWQEYEKAIEVANQYIGKTGNIVLEEYIEGEQYSIETISFLGKHYIVGVTKEYISGIPNFLERSHYTNKEIFEKRTFFSDFIKETLDILDVQVGPCHIEVIVKNGEIYLIDFATRSGGWRSKLLKYACGSFYNKLILQSYLNQKIDIDSIIIPSKTATVGILMYKSDMEQYNQAKKNGDLEEVYFYDKNIVSNPTTLIDAYGYFYASYKGCDFKYKLKI